MEDIQFVQDEFDGQFEHIEGRTLYGWIYRPSSPDRSVDIDIVIDGSLVSVIPATEYRSDLATFGIGNGAHSFAFVIPKSYFDGHPHTLQVREHETGWVLPSSVEKVVLETRYADDFAGHLFEATERGIGGYAYSHFVADQPVKVRIWDAMIQIAQVDTGIAVENRDIAGGIPAQSGFFVPFDKFPLNKVIGKTLSVTVGDQRQEIGTIAPESLKAFASVAFTVMPQVVEATVTLNTISNAVTSFDIYIDSEVNRRVEIGAGVKAVSFFIALQYLNLESDTSISAKYSGTEIEIPGSPILIKSRKVNLVENPNFATWDGARAVGWDIACSAGTQIATQFDDLNAPGQGQTALRFTRGDIAGAGLVGTRIGQTIVFPRTADTFLDVVVRAKGSRYDTIDVLLGIPGAEHAETLSKSLEIWPDWTTSIVRFQLPRDFSDLKECRLDFVFRNPNQSWVSVAMITAGVPGFSFDVSAQEAGQARIQTQAVLNADFSTWNPHHLKRNTHKLRRMDVAEGWCVRSKSGNTDVNVRLTEISTRDPANAEAGRHAYAVALTGDVHEGYLRLECDLDTIQLSTTAPNQMRFLAQLDSNLAGGSGSALGHKGTIAEIFVLQRLGKEGEFRDTKLFSLRRRIEVGTQLRRFDLAIPDADGQQIQQLAQRGIYEEECRFLVVFEFHKRIDVVLTDVRFGHLSAANDPDRNLANFLSVEDMNIANQISLLKGIEPWGRNQICVASANTRLRDQDAPLSVKPWNWTSGGGQLIDIVVPVHNAIDDTLVCLRSILEHTSIPYVLTIVDDASDGSAKEQMRSLIRGLPWVRFIETPENIGYTRTANIGLSSTGAPWIVLLNSDTIVTPHWLEGLLEVAAARPDVAMVGPVSNAASWQSVPNLRDVKGGWCVNSLPDGLSAADFSTLVAQHALRDFPEIPLLNGFCTLMRADVIASVGYLDEVAFPVGYGEENDLCIRVAEAGYKLAVADHVYVHHIKSASFGTSKREVLSKKGTKSFATKHPGVDLNAIQSVMAELTALTTLRQRLRQYYV